MLKLLLQDRQMSIWWGTPVECQSSVYRRHRDTPQPPPLLEKQLDRLQAFLQDADTVPPTDRVRLRAGRLLAGHFLRAADAIQLAAALTGCGEKPAGETFVCLDLRLRQAAEREGFTVLPAS
jgi:hypothetical protein